MERTIALQLLDEYQDLNPPICSIKIGAPTSLEFMRQVHISKPMLFKNTPLISSSLWTDEYLARKVGLVTVAVTPDGRADALVQSEDGSKYFTEPHSEKTTMRDLLQYLLPENTSDEVFYLQSQNGNLFPSNEGDCVESEFESISMDVPRDITWATESLGRTPDAVNIWIGDHRSVTSIHSDPYENVYSVIRGTKIFTLLPPVAGYFLEENEYPHAKWVRDLESQKLTLAPSGNHSSVRWSSIKDPTIPLAHVRPITVVVEEGETLYLPAGWWHYVQQRPDYYGKCIAINYWYDIQMEGHHWVWLSFLRGLSLNSREDNRGENYNE